MVTCVGLIAWRADKLHAPGPHRLAGLARGGVPREQPAVRRRSRSSCCSARSSRCSPRRCAASSCRWGSRTSTAWARRSGSMLLFLMAVAPALPWRADERRGAAAAGCCVPAYRRRRRDAAHARLRRPATGRTVRRVRARHVRGRRDRPRDGRRGAGPPPGRRRRLGARRSAGTVRGQPAPLRRPRRAHRRGRDRGRRSPPAARSAPSRRSGSPAARVADGRRATRSRSSDRRVDRSAPEELGLGRPEGRAGAATTSAPTRPRSRRSRTRPPAIGTPSVRTGLLEDVYLTIVSSPNEQGRITIGMQTELDDALALDRRRTDGARHDRRARARRAPAGHGRAGRRAAAGRTPPDDGDAGRGATVTARSRRDRCGAPA